jgi:hypothetical protein
VNDERIDLSSLDPSRNTARWEATICFLAALAAAARRRVTFARQVLLWARPSLAIAAGVALVVWTGVLVRGQRTTAPGAAIEAPEFMLSRWAMSDEAPPTTTVLSVLGNQDGLE